MKVNITEVQIIPIKPHNGLVGFASFVLNDDWYMGSIGIVTNQKRGYRLVYPTKKVGVNNRNIYHPINKKIARVVEEEIINQFDEVMKKYGGLLSMSMTVFTMSLDKRLQKSIINYQIYRKPRMTTI